MVLSGCALGSEAGGEDALVGNVNKLLVAPPGSTGAQRKGHLVFDACFESGRSVVGGGSVQLGGQLRVRWVCGWGR